MDRTFSSPGLGGLKPQKPGVPNTLPLPLGVRQETLTLQTCRGHPSAGDRPSKSLGAVGQVEADGKECEFSGSPDCPLEGAAPCQRRTREGAGSGKTGLRGRGEAGLTLTACGWRGEGGVKELTFLAARHGAWQWAPTQAATQEAGCDIQALREAGRQGEDRDPGSGRLEGIEVWGES